MLTSPDRPGSSGAESVSLLSEDDDEKCTFYKPRPFMERLDLSHLGPVDVFQSVEDGECSGNEKHRHGEDDNQGETSQAINSTPRRNLNFELPRSPRTDATSADRNAELRRLRRKSIESPRSFLNGLSGVESLPAVIAAVKKDNRVILPSQILLVSLV
uniref:Uncharacterized protein n=1 Tax=Caenorhabditis japonica TaxID=281687 RepID=A0A8R1II19_CAEJA